MYTIGPIGLSGKFLKDETNFTLIIVQIRIDFVKYQRTSDWQKNLIFRRWQSLPRAVLKAMQCQISSEMKRKNRHNVDVGFPVNVKLSEKVKWPTKVDVDN